MDTAIVFVVGACLVLVFSAGFYVGVRTEEKYQMTQWVEKDKT